METLPLSNIINVSLTTTPSGILSRNANNVAIFTTESPSGLDDYITAVTARQVELEYGSGSVTANMAQAIFSQTPNILSGGGTLVVVPFGGVSATQGQFVTIDLTSKLAALIAVDDGDLKVTIDSVEYNLTNIDFTDATTIAEVASILQKKLKNAVITVASNIITIKSKKVGTASTVAMGAVSGGSGTDLSGASYFSTSGGTATAGSASSGETLEEAITRIESQVKFAGIITDQLIEDTVFDSLADYIQAKDYILVHQFSSSADILGIGETIRAAGNTKTRVLVYTDFANANQMKSAYAGRAFSVNFNGSLTSQTMNLKGLAGISPDSGVDQTMYINARDTAGVDLYVSYEGVSATLSSGRNSYFDEVHSNLALKYQLEESGFNYLRQTNTKVPQTEAGMDGLKNAYAQVCERFVNNGYIGVGLVWSSSETFGDPETFHRNITEKGYYVYSQPISQQATEDRLARIAPLVQIAIKAAGAIHRSNVLVIVNP